MRLYTTPRFAPLPDTQRIHWPTVADELHARPGEWAAVGTQDCGRHPLNRDKLAALGLECTSRSNGDGTWTIWMRGIDGWQPERVQPKTPAQVADEITGKVADAVAGAAFDALAAVGLPALADLRPTPAPRHLQVVPWRAPHRGGRGLMGALNPIQTVKITNGATS